MTEEQARNHPGVLAGERLAKRDQRCPGGWSTGSISGQRAASRRYARTEKGRAKDARYRAANREKVLASCAAYYAAHREWKLAYNTAYYAAHRKAILAHVAAYRQTLPAYLSVAKALANRHRRKLEALTNGNA